MSSDKFNSLLEDKIINYKNKFEKLSRDLFTNTEDEKLYHPGEFGIYRESITREFLKYFIPYSLDISTGFLINSENEISTQVDIVVFDPSVTLLLEDEYLQRFFQIESTVGIGEVKSKLNKQQLKEALNKLARNKSMRNSKSLERAIMKDKSKDPKLNDVVIPNTNLTSFLICQKLEFDIYNLPIQIDEMYDNDILDKYKHNFILSLEDGLFCYKDDEGNNTPWPTLKNKKLKNLWIKPGETGLEHIFMFAHFVNLSIKHTEIFEADFLFYMKSFILNRISES